MARYMNRPENALKRANGEWILVKKSKVFYPNGSKWLPHLNTATTLTGFHNPTKMWLHFCVNFFFAVDFLDSNWLSVEESTDFNKIQRISMWKNVLLCSSAHPIQSHCTCIWVIHAVIYVSEYHVFVWWKGQEIDATHNLMRPSYQNSMMQMREY